jgi:hypothetical protein
MHKDMYCQEDAKRSCAVHSYVLMTNHRWSSYLANGLTQSDARLTPHLLYLDLDVEPLSRCNAYRALFRPQLDADAASEVREALQLGMPLGSERFAETVCARLGIRRNTGKRGRSPRDQRDSLPVQI